MAIQSQELRILVRALTDPSVQVAAREVVVFLRQIQGDLRAVSQEARSTEGAFGHVTGGIVGFLRDVAATASGILVRDVVQGGLRLLKEGFLELNQVMIGSNALYEQATTAISVMAGGMEKAGAMMDAVRKASKEVGMGYSEMVRMSQPLIPFAQGSSQALYEMLRATLALQAYMPEKGTWGAMRAITEAMADQYVSLARLYNIPLRTIQQLKDEGKRGLELILAALEKQGVGWDLVTAQADTFVGMLTTLKGVSQDFFRLLGEPVFKGLSADLMAVRNWVRQNEEGIMALAQVIGTELANAYQFVRNTLTKWLGLEELSLDRVVQWGMNFIASLVNGILDGVDRYLMPAIVAVASLIASFLAGASPPEVGPLSDIDEGGANMLEAYVDGILNSDAPKKVREVAEEIRRELLQDERVARLRELVARAEQRGAALVEAAQKRVAAAQREVEEATKRVQAAQERLNEFARDTAEIPERFTRARKRQLEAELRAAQQEQQGKQDALKATQEILRAAQEQSRAIVEAARQHEQAVKQQMSAEEKRLKLLEKLQKAVEESGGFQTGVTGDIEAVGGKIDQLIEKYKLMWRIAMAGPPGEEGEAGAPGRYAESKWASITAQFETLSTLSGTIATNVRNITADMEKIAGTVQSVIDAYDKLPDWLKDALSGQLTLPNILGGWGKGPGGLPSGGPLGTAIFDIFDRLKQKAQDLGIAKSVEEDVGKLPPVIGSILYGPAGSVIFELLAGKSKMAKAAQESLLAPVLSKAEELYKALVGRSIIPDMLGEILRQYERLRSDVLPVIEKFVQDALAQFQRLSDWVLEELPLTVAQIAEYTEQMGLGFDQLTAEVKALNLALERLVELLERLPALPNLPTVGEVMTRQAAQPAMATALAGRAAGLTARAGMGETPYLHVGLIDQRGWQISADVDEITVKRWSRESALAAIRQVLREAR